MDLVEPADQVGHMLDHVAGDEEVETRVVADDRRQWLALPDMVDIDDLRDVDGGVVVVLPAQAGGIHMIEVADVGVVARHGWTIERADLDADAPDVGDVLEEEAPTIHLRAGYV